MPSSTVELQGCPDGWFQRMGALPIEERIPALKALMTEYLEKNGGYLVPLQMLQIVQALAEDHDDELRDIPRRWRVERGIR